MEQDLSSRVVPIFDKKVSIHHRHHHHRLRDFHKVGRDLRIQSLHESKPRVEKQKPEKIKTQIPREISCVVCFEKVPMNSLLTIAHTRCNRGEYSFHNPNSAKLQEYKCLCNTQNLKAASKHFTTSSRKIDFNFLI